MQEKSESPGTRPSLTTYLGVAAISAAVGFAAVYVTLGRPDNTEVAEPALGDAKPATGKPDAGALAGFVRKAVPEAITDVAFLGPDGKEVKLSSFKGRAVLLNLWATWCAPCRKEMPSLDRLQKELGSDKFAVVALAVDRTGLEGAGKFLAETKVASLTLYADPAARAGTTLKALGLPTTILIDKEGREMGRLAGPADWDSPEAKRIIETALR